MCARHEPNAHAHRASDAVVRSTFRAINSSARGRRRGARAMVSASLTGAALGFCAALYSNGLRKMPLLRSTCARARDTV